MNLMKLWGLLFGNNQPQGSQKTVPYLKGKTEKEAVDELLSIGLRICRITEENQNDAAMVGKVINQKPPAGSSISGRGAVDITIAAKKVV